MIFEEALINEIIRELGRIWEDMVAE